MLGRFCTVSTRGNQTDLCHEESKATGAGLSDYACPECGAQQYHLVFRVEALSHHMTLTITCDACSGRTNLPTDDCGLKQLHASAIAMDEDFGTSHH